MKENVTVLQSYRIFCKQDVDGWGLHEVHHEFKLLVVPVLPRFGLLCGDHVLVVGGVEKLPQQLSVMEQKNSSKQKTETTALPVKEQRGKVHKSSKELKTKILKP